MKRWLSLVFVLAGCRQILGIHDRGEEDDDPGVGSGGPATSCAALADDCTGLSCCDSRLVPGGAFVRSHDVAEDGVYADASAVATVRTFRLDRFEVTVGRFRAFVDAGKGTKADPPPAGSGSNAFFPASGWDSNFNAELRPDRASLVAALHCGTINAATWTDTPGDHEQHPINCVSWFEAFAFCAWDGGFLPTEAEWNYAAAGGDQQRAYPFSDPPGDTTVTPDDLVYVDTTSYPVGSKPAGAGRWHHADLAGNVFEWVLDRYAAYTTPCDDCANVVRGNDRVLRGGVFFRTEDFARTAKRESVFASGTSRGEGFGIRCARLP